MCFHFHLESVFRPNMGTRDLSGNEGGPPPNHVVLTDFMIPIVHRCEDHCPSYNFHKTEWQKPLHKSFFIWSASFLLLCVLKAGSSEEDKHICPSQDLIRTSDRTEDVNVTWICDRLLKMITQTRRWSKSEEFQSYEDLGSIVCVKVHYLSALIIFKLNTF